MRSALLLGSHVLLLLADPRRGSAGMRAVGSGWKHREHVPRPPATQPPAEFPQAPFHSVHTPPPGEDHCPEVSPSAVMSVSEFLVNGVEQRALLRVWRVPPAATPLCPFSCRAPGRPPASAVTNKAARTLVHSSLCGIVVSFLLGKYLGIELLGHG